MRMALGDMDGSRGIPVPLAGCGWLWERKGGLGNLWIALEGCGWLCGEEVSKAELMLPEASDCTETEQGPPCHACSALMWE